MPCSVLLSELSAGVSAEVLPVCALSPAVSFCASATGFGCSAEIGASLLAAGVVVDPPPPQEELLEELDELLEEEEEV